MQDDRTTARGRSTRSTTTVPNDILREASAYSPLKAARKTAARGRTTTSNSSSSLANQDNSVQEDEAINRHEVTEAGRDREGEEEDTLATEPSRSKRSASPPAIDEYTKSTPPLTGRELKRLKTEAPVDSEHEGTDPARTTSRSKTPSDSNAPPLKRTKSRQGSAKPHSRKPNSAGHQPPAHTRSSPPPDPVTGRAQSVPVFPSSYALPQIDLRHPPPSPNRNKQRSRSPSKEPHPKLRIQPIAPSQSSQSLLEPILDEPTTETNDSEMNVDKDSSGAPSPSTQDKEPTPPASASADNAAHSPIEPSSPKVKFSQVVQFKDAETPMPAPDSFNGADVFGNSPLTPMPDTPLAPSEARSAAVRKRLAELKAEQDDEEDVEEDELEDVGSHQLPT